MNASSVKKITDWTKIKECRGEKAFVRDLVVSSEASFKVYSP